MLRPNGPSFLLCSVFLLACVGQPLDEDVSQREDAIIYGEDDRLDVIDHPDALLQDIAVRSVGGLIDRRLVDPSGTIRTATASQRIEATFGVPYCEDEPFRDQPAPMDCSGVLIDEDLFLTAAHCVPTQDFCDDLSVVLGYRIQAGGDPRPLTPEDVYDCASIEVVSYLRDYAIIKLDRPVSGDHAPALVRQGPDPVRPGDLLSVIGHPSGTPMKIDDGTTAGASYDPGIESFLFRGDVVAGSSGSPVFNRAGEVLGVVSRGQEEPFRVTSTCVEVQREAAGEPGTEIAGYIYRAMHDLCAAGRGSRTLCADSDAWCEGECGGGGCSIGTRGSSSGWALVGALVGLGLLRRRRSRR